METEVMWVRPSQEDGKVEVMLANYDAEKEQYVMRVFMVVPDDGHYHDGDKVTVNFS